MFKRVEKRRLKKEEEEELGLDEDMKEILGMHDTDSEESASDSDNEDGSDDEDEGQEMQVSGGDSAAEDGEEDEEEGDESADENDEEEDPNVTVRQALTDSIYVVSVQPEVKACIVCPGKLLKGAKMVQLHRIAKACTLPLAHERRLRQFKTLAANAEPDESAWEVLQRSAEEKPKLSLAPSENATSKRAEKKKAREASLKLRREKRKAKLAKEAEKKKAAAAAALSAGASSSSSSGPIPEGVPVQQLLAKPNPKSSKKSKKEKPEVDATSNSPTKASSPPKKKRKVERAAEEGVVTPPVPSAVNNQLSDKKPRKPKHSKTEHDTVDAASSNSTTKLPSAEVKDSVKTIARSISDRTKSARDRALAASKGNKDTTKRPKKKAVAVS